MTKTLEQNESRKNTNSQKDPETKWERGRWREKMGENGKEGILNAQLWTKEIVVYSRFGPPWRVGGSSYVYLALQHTVSLFFSPRDWKWLPARYVHGISRCCSTVHKTVCGKKGWVCNFLLFLLPLRFCLAGNGRYKTGEKKRGKRKRVENGHKGVKSAKTSKQVSAKHTTRKRKFSWEITIFGKSFHAQAASP